MYSLEGKRVNYQVCSVQYCVQQLCTVQCTDMNTPNRSLDWVLSHWAHFTVLRFIFVYVLLHACVVLYHGEVDLVGLKFILSSTTSFSALTLLVGSFDL